MALADSSSAPVRQSSSKKDRGGDVPKVFQALLTEERDADVLSLISQLPMGASLSGYEKVLQKEGSEPTQNEASVAGILSKEIIPAGDSPPHQRSAVLLRLVHRLGNIINSRGVDLMHHEPPHFVEADPQKAS